MPANQPPSPIAAGRMIGGRYRLVRRLGRSALTDVWEGHDEVLARPVAIKFLHRELGGDPEMAEWFERAAKNAARLAHPNIAATYDTGELDGAQFVVAELVPARTLREWLDSRGPLSPAMAGSVGRALAAALEHAHGRGVVHGGLSPLSVRLGDDGGVKVGDFGTTGGARPGGTPQRDVHSVGALLYEAVAGRPPLRPPDEPESLRRIRPGTPKTLERVALGALAGKFESAEALRSALAAVDTADDDALPLVDRHPTPPAGVAPAHRPARQPRAVPAAIAVLAVAALAVAGFVVGRPGDDGAGVSGGGAGSNGADDSLRIRPAAARSFDPEGDGTEKERLVGNLLDGNPTTAWTTDQYERAGFAGLKDGVGVVLTLDRRRPLRALHIAGANRGWTADVHVADQPAPSLGRWGKAVATVRVDGQRDVSLQGREAGAVLLWITDPGPERQVRIGELGLTG